MIPLLSFQSSLPPCVPLPSLEPISISSTMPMIMNPTTSNSSSPIATSTNFDITNDNIDTAMLTVDEVQETTATANMSVNVMEVNLQSQVDQIVDVNPLLTLLSTSSTSTPIPPPPVSSISSGSGLGP